MAGGCDGWDLLHISCGCSAWGTASFQLCIVFWQCMQGAFADDLDGICQDHCSITTLRPLLIKAWCRRSSLASQSLFCFGDFCSASLTDCWICRDDATALVGTDGIGRNDAIWAFFCTVTFGEACNMVGSFELPDLCWPDTALLEGDGTVCATLSEAAVHYETWYGPKDPAAGCGASRMRVNAV